MFWSSPSDARREYEAMLPLVTTVVGNRAEVEVAVGTRDAELAAARLLEAGVKLAVVKMGADGVLVATAQGTHTVPPHPIEVVNGLGAGDAFGAALAHGLLAGWDAPTIGAYANAAGAIVASRLACSDAMPTLQELESAMAGTPV
jgi:5-dehydro-2-deoxygluconokinase